MVCFERSSVSWSSGASFVIVEPAPMVAPAPTLTGATSIAPEPMKAPSPISVRVLVRAVVIAGDGAGADIDLLADGRVAEVGQVIGLAARAEDAVLDLDEVADVHARGQAGARPEARERTDVAVGPMLARSMTQFGNTTVSSPISLSRITTFGPIRTRLPSFTTPSSTTLTSMSDVAADRDRATRVEAQRVDQRDALEHQLGGTLLAIGRLELGELQLVVDAQDLGDRGCDDGVHLEARPDRHDDDVRQVVLALRIVVPECAQARP